LEEIKLPVWHIEMMRFQSFKSTFILDGNIHDLQAYPSRTESGVRWDLLHMDRYLYNYLTENGYRTVVFYDSIDGFYNAFQPDAVNQFLALSQQHGTARSSQEGGTGAYRATLDRASEMIQKAMSGREEPVAIVLNYASRYYTNPGQLSEEERQFTTRFYQTSLKPVQVRSKSNERLLNHLLFFITNKVNDLPAWFYLDNPYVKTLKVPKPEKQVRRRFIESQLRFFAGSDQYTPQELEKHVERFQDYTEGFSNIELNGLKTLCRQENIPLDRIQDAISLFKYGIKENPWHDLNRQKLMDAEAYITKRVKGQHAAVQQTLDIIKRAVSGMSGMQHSAQSSKPKGILFFAGPTGTGKTELAKTLAGLLFGNDNAFIRFDMSEYQQSHSDQKLLGAPPGYVGYEAGGQLTNAMKEKPFSIVLFDEIEKAHPSILDKFLQILEDGRMTDGQGDTVYFSESVIIFTSNLGIYRQDEFGSRIANAVPTDSYADNRPKILSAIKDYFVQDLGRPEILNRFGDNFVVFDYIREPVAIAIIESQLEKIQAVMKEQKGITIGFSQHAKSFLLGKCLNNLENGGRGIGNVIEKHAINPLSRYLFDYQVDYPCKIEIMEMTEADDITSLTCDVNRINGNVEVDSGER